MTAPALPRNSALLKAIPAPDEWRIVRGRASFQRFQRVFDALSRQPQYRETVGAAVWTLIRWAGPVIYCARVRHTCPSLVSIERNGVVLGSITLTRSGQLANIVIQGSAAERPAVLRRLCAEIDGLLAGDDRAYRARTFDTNRSIRAALRRRGFVTHAEAQHVVTVPLGPLTFSWIQRREASLPFLVSRRLLRLERPPRGG